VKLFENVTRTHMHFTDISFSSVLGCGHKNIAYFLGSSKFNLLCGRKSNCINVNFMCWQKENEGRRRNKEAEKERNNNRESKREDKHSVLLSGV